MDLIDSITQISSRISKIREIVQTEEATKNALVMPLIQALGYDVFNPTEVVPEFNADVGVKKNEKVDYAIIRNGKPAILIECKSIGTSLNLAHASQLFRYFSVTEARFAILTNGVDYQFFTDIEAPNIMDEKPFFEFSMEQVDAKIADELKKFGKNIYDEENILSNASELKYKKQLRNLFSQEFNSPSEEFVKLFARRVYSGVMNHQRIIQFSELVGDAFREWVSSRINERLQNAIDGVEIREGEKTHEAAQTEVSDSGIVTTADEITAYQYIQAILAQIMPPERVVMRDAKSYCAILLDDNNRKPVCRLYFSKSRNDIVIVDKSRSEEKFSLSKLTEIFGFAEKIKLAARSYEATSIVNE